jgi:branched-chain amino acid transport system permease protein
MAQVTQARWMTRPELDYDKLSGRYMSLGGMIALVRILWVIARTSGIMGTSPADYLKSIEDGLSVFHWVYAGIGVILLLAALVDRIRREDSSASLRVLVNFGGALILLVFANRVTTVVNDNASVYKAAFWAQQLSNGLILGSVYALVALGYTLVYGILFMINFAHGEVLVTGMYGGYFALLFMTDRGGGVFEDGAASIAAIVFPLVVAALFLPLETLVTRSRRQRPQGTKASQWLFTSLTLPVRFLLGMLVGYGLLQALGGFAPTVYLWVITIVGLVFVLVVGMISSMLTAITVERIAYRPLRRAPRLTPLISAIGASFFLQQAMLNIFGAGQKFYVRPKLISKTVKLSLGDLGTVPLTQTGIIIVVFSVVLMVLLYLFVQRSKTGRAMRSVAEDKDTAALMGVDVDQVIVTTFALGAMLAGAAGVMLGFHNLSFGFRSGFIPGLKAFTAAVLGGIGNIPGAMFGGLFLGLVEALGPTMLGIGTQDKDVIAFGLLVLVLIFRPTGIFGEVLSEKKV